MAETPTYPEDAPVGDPVGNPADPAEEGSSEKKGEGNRTRQIVTGAAIGIGSAALVAALLYANRSRKGASRRS